MVPFEGIPPSFTANDSAPATAMSCELTVDVSGHKLWRSKQNRTLFLFVLNNSMRTNTKTNQSHCKNCSKLFTKLFDSNRVHCTAECVREFRIKNKKIKVKPTKICPKCDTPHLKDGVFCSRGCANVRIRTEEFKQQRSEYALANPSGWATNPKAYNNTSERWAKKRLTLACLDCKKLFEVPFSQRHRKYCSIDCTNKNKYHPNSTKKHRTFYNGYWMDSGAELLFAQELDKLNIHWHKNSTEYFSFTKSNNKQSKYYPDFYLKDYDIWVEVKGLRYVREDDELRRAAVPKPVFLLISNKFKKYFNDFLEYIGDRQGERFPLISSVTVK